MKFLGSKRMTAVRLCLALVLGVGMASIPGQGAKAYIDLTAFAPKVDFGTGLNTYVIATGDLDGDGKPDLVSANYGASTLSALRNTSTPGNLSFAAKADFATGYHPMGVALSDLDGDGKLDAAVANYDANTLSVLRNTSTPGSISFATQAVFATGGLPIMIAASDLDGDGKPDLAVSNILSHTVSVLRNTSTPGSISFAAQAFFSAGLSPYGICITDLDGDGKGEVVVTNYNLGANTVSALRNTSTPGNISFAPRVAFGTGQYPLSVAPGDLDGDGKPDLAVANIWGNSVSALRNTSTPGNISFAARVDFGSGNTTIQVASADLDGDGMPEVVTANYNDNTVSVLRNTSTSGNLSFATRVDFGTGVNPYGLAIGDLDGDGMPDLVAGNFSGNSISVLRNLVDIIYPVLLSGANLGAARLAVTFSEDVKHDGSAGAADNPANYLLFEAGANERFDTFNCAGGVLRDDTRLAVNSATYDPATFTATLTINGGRSLPSGIYRLLICGTTSIEDLAGNELNGGEVDGVFDFHLGTATLPATGFAPQRVSLLPPQTTFYAPLGDLWLEIPALGVQTPIVGVPQANGSWDVTWLGGSAGWLAGSAFPSLAGNSVLTGHVYDANGDPGLFAGLNRLWWGDQVIVHAWDQEYIYEVRSVMQVSPNNSAAMMKHQDLPWLTLVTCRGFDEASGSYKYRVLVRAVLVEVK